MITRIVICLLTLVGVARTQEETKQPVELGRIAWLRDLADARGAEKPLLLLFQEVPG